MFYMVMHNYMICTECAQHVYSELALKWVLGSDLYAAVIFPVFCGGGMRMLLNNGHRKSRKEISGAS